MNWKHRKKLKRLGFTSKKAYKQFVKSMCVTSAFSWMSTLEYIKG